MPILINSSFKNEEPTTNFFIGIKLRGKSGNNFNENGKTYVKST